MLKWLLELFHGAGSGGSPPPAGELASLIQERRRLAEVLASYREFGFDAQFESCKDRLRRVQARIRELQGRTDAPAAEPGRGDR